MEFERFGHTWESGTTVYNTSYGEYQTVFHENDPEYLFVMSDYVKNYRGSWQNIDHYVWTVNRRGYINGFSKEWFRVQALVISGPCAQCEKPIDKPDDYLCRLCRQNLLK